MARIRTIKPEFFTSEQIAECSPNARLLFIGMWCFCDDQGIHPASYKSLKMQIFPGDDLTINDIKSYVEQLLINNLLIEYVIEDKTYWQVTGWNHQKIDRPNPKYPQPNNSTIIRRSFDDQSPPEGKGRESKGKESKGEVSIPPAPKNENLKKMLLENLPDEWRDYAKSEKGWDNSVIEIVWSGFRDYWQDGKGKTVKRKEWSATWKKWCLKENINTQQGGNYAQRTKPSFKSTGQNIAAKYRENAEREEQGGIGGDSIPSLRPPEAIREDT